MIVYWVLDQLLNFTNSVYWYDFGMLGKWQRRNRILYKGRVLYLGLVCTRLVRIRNILGITEHHRYNNLLSFSTKPQTKWFRSRFKFFMMTVFHSLRRRETMNCYWCSSDIQPLWTLMLKQNSTSHLFPIKWELCASAATLLPYSAQKCGETADTFFTILE